MAHNLKKSIMETQQRSLGGLSTAMNWMLSAKSKRAST